VLETLARCDPWWALVALAALTLDRLLMSFKWGLLLTIRGYSLSIARRMMVYCSAMMWGLALPSTVGADGVRIWLTSTFGVRADDSFATILVERGIGFVSALVMALLGLAILRTLVPDAMAYDAAIALGMLGTLGALCLLLFSFSERAGVILRKVIPQRWEQSRPAQLLERLHTAYRSLSRDRTRIGAFAALTLLEQLLMVACYGLTAVALGVEFNPVFLLAAVPLAILVSRLPISLDGIGVYEGIFIGVMALAGMRAEDALAISLAARALQIIVWLPWWLAMLAHGGSRKAMPLSFSRPAGD
jgi:uncharacterized protein (TIRG00374 family)